MRRYGAILLWYKAGVAAVEGSFQERTKSWLIAKCYRDTLPMLLGIELCCATVKVAGAGATGQEAVTGWGVDLSKEGTTQRSRDVVGRRSRAVFTLGGDAGAERSLDQHAACGLRLLLAAGCCRKVL